MKLRALLDTSVLIALLDANHVHHRLCSQWLSIHTAGWASCPITLNGCVRIMSQPSYPNRLPMQAVVAGLQQAMRHPMHVFWADDINPLDTNAIDWQQVLRPAGISSSQNNFLWNNPMCYSYMENLRHANSQCIQSEKQPE